MRNNMFCISKKLLMLVSIFLLTVFVFFIVVIFSKNKINKNSKASVFNCRGVGYKKAKNVYIYKNQSCCGNATTGSICFEPAFNLSLLGINNYGLLNCSTDELTLQKESCFRYGKTYISNNIPTKTPTPTPRETTVTVVTNNSSLPNEQSRFLIRGDDYGKGHLNYMYIGDFKVGRKIYIIRIINQEDTNVLKQYYKQMYELQMVKNYRNEYIVLPVNVPITISDLERTEDILTKYDYLNNDLYKNARLIKIKVLNQYVIGYVVNDVIKLVKTNISRYYKLNSNYDDIDLFDESGALGSYLPFLWDIRGTEEEKKDQMNSDDYNQLSPKDYIAWLPKPDGDLYYQCESYEDYVKKMYDLKEIASSTCDFGNIRKLFDINSFLGKVVFKINRTDYQTIDEINFELIDLCHTKVKFSDFEKTFSSCKLNR